MVKKAFTLLNMLVVNHILNLKLFRRKNSGRFQRRDLTGFTLIELLIVVAIIGILATIVIVNVSDARRKSKIAKAKADLTSIRTAIGTLEIDTGQQPNHLLAKPCVQNPEVNLNQPAAGLVANDTVTPFPNWNGPYIGTNVLIDPWGSPYHFDPDHMCFSDEGCTNVWGKTIRAIISLGPDKSAAYGDATNHGDNIVLPLCSS